MSLTTDEIGNVCRALLLQMTEHLTTPSRQSELKIFMLIQRCDEIGMLHTSGTVLELMASEVMKDGDR